MTFSKFGQDFQVRWLALIVILTVAVFAACGKSESKTNEQTNAGQRTQNEVFTVTQARATAREIPAFISATGSLVADETSDIAPKTAGKVINVSANVGEFVGQGSVIAKLDERDAQLQLVQAKANVAQAVSAVRQAEARLGLAPNGTFRARRRFPKSAPPTPITSKPSPNCGKPRQTKNAIVNWSKQAMSPSLLMNNSEPCAIRRGRGSITRFSNWKRRETPRGRAMKR